MAHQAKADVAVYGTLRRGQRNHPLLDRAAFLGMGVVQGALFDVPRTPYRTLRLPGARPVADRARRRGGLSARR